MKRWLPFVALALLFAFFALPAAAGLDVGDTAPDFSLQGSDGQIHRLRDYIGGEGPGKHGAVIAWFPKAFTPG